MNDNSKALFQEAKQYIPGGVNSPVRAGKSVGIDPPFIAKAKDCFIWDIDGKQYIDYVSSWGPMILGHAHHDVIAAIEKKLPLGTSYGAPTRLEVEMARTIVEMVPSIEMVRMVNSGTEAAMSAIRLARGFTGRDKIIKFDGCYHGHADCLLISAGSGIATLGIPGSPGIPANLAKDTISIPFNDPEAVKKTFDKFGSEIAAVIVEPVPGNMGIVIPEKDFLTNLRALTSKNGSLLIFDEVISGFRLAPGGAQEIYGIQPDLTCLGKIIGGGLPVGAYGGKKEIMQKMAPEGDVYQAGTLSGNPLAMAAGMATLTALKNNDFYQRLDKKGDLLFSGLKDAAEEAGIPVTINHIGSIGTLFFTPGPVIDFESAKISDQKLFRRFFRSMLDQGVYMAPSPFEAIFLSIAHSDDVIEKTVVCAKRALKNVSSPS